jgi:DNA-binding GntR family transcriptional regulator
MTQPTHAPTRLDPQSESLELYSILAVLEGEAIGLVTPYIPDSQIRKGIAQLDKIPSQSQEDRQEFRRVEQMFHLGIHNYCPNRSLRLLITQVRVEMEIYLKIFETHLQTPHFEEIKIEWRDIFTAMLSHDASLATQRMRQHITAARDRLESLTSLEKPKTSGAYNG